MKKILFLLSFNLFVCASFVAAQQNPADKPSKQTAVQTTAQTSFTAKYEGGMFGFEKKQEGTLKFDDANERLVFFGKDNKEQFAIPYEAMNLIQTGTRSVRSGAGTAVSVIPLPGAGLAGLFREKRRYLVISFSDPDVVARGIVNFKLENDKTREAVIHTLGKKANLIQRGDAYYRQRKTPSTEL
jgi:hypothetical protein